MKILSKTDTTVTVREYGKTRTIPRFDLETDPRGVGVRDSPVNECYDEALRKARARGRL